MALGDPPERLGMYDVVRRLAVGGTTEVLLGALPGEGASSPGSGAPTMRRKADVAIKRLLPHHAASSELAGLLRDVAARALRLRHPNVVKVVDFGEEDGRLFVVLEY